MSCLDVFDDIGVVGVLFLSLPALGCFEVSDDISLVCMLFPSLSTQGYFHASDGVGLVSILFPFLSSQVGFKIDHYCSQYLALKFVSFIVVFLYQ